MSRPPVAPGGPGSRTRPFGPRTAGHHGHLKDSAGRDLVLRLVERADVLMEGYRPGVAERLGLGPDDCRARNPRLVYARMTGWDQTAPSPREPVTTSTTSHSPAPCTRSGGQVSAPFRR